MADDIKLEAEIRRDTGTDAAKRVRKDGMVPCILYGLNKENVALSIPYNRLESALLSGKRMVDLGIAKKRETVLVKDLQHHPVTDRIIHVDFERIAMDEEIDIEIPVVLEGRSKGADDGGVVDQILKSLQVKCLPVDIPEEVTIDITDLDINDSYKVQDIKLSEGVTAVTGEDEMVVVIHPPAKEEEETVPEEGVSAEPEVLTERKEEEGSEDQKDKEQKG